LLIGGGVAAFAIARYKQRMLGLTS
jgi:hypothetical protein